MDRVKASGPVRDRDRDQFWGNSLSGTGTSTQSIRLCWPGPDGPDAASVKSMLPPDFRERYARARDGNVEFLEAVSRGPDLRKPDAENVACKGVEDDRRPNRARPSIGPDDDIVRTRNPDRPTTDGQAWRDGRHRVPHWSEPGRTSDLDHAGPRALAGEH